MENVKQAGDVVVFVSGKGSRSTLVQAVRTPANAWRIELINQQDLMFTGGVVQVIDSLLIPPANLTSTIDVNAFNLTSFEGALFNTDLVTYASDTPNITIFAPSNEAFQALGPAISQMTVSELSTVLDYHFLPQIVYSTGLTNGTKFLTAQGENITVLHSGNNIYLNSAQLLTTDILLANGVLHVIDNVLNPQGPGAYPNPQLATQVPAYASASSVSNLPFTSDIPCTLKCVTSTSHKASSTSAGSKSTAAAKTTASVQSSSSKALGAAVAKQTGFGAAGLVVALGGAMMMI